MKLLTSFLLVLSFSTLAGNKDLKVHFIDIGQADATLFEFKCGAVLIDAGAQVSSTTKSSEKLMRYLQDFFDRRQDLNSTLDTILITHNHQDHTGSLDEIAEKFVVKNIVSTKHNLKDDVTDLVDDEQGISHKYLSYSDAKSKIPNGLYYNEN